MSEPAKVVPQIEEPDVSHLVTEDDEPVESPFQDQQMRFLVQSLHASWPYPDRSFVAFADVGLFSSTLENAIVPDVLLSIDVTQPPGPPLDKNNRSYFFWRYGKAPDVVIEIVSGDEGGEEEKLTRYARMGIPYAVIYDPATYLSPRPLRAFELRGGNYVQLGRSLRPVRKGNGGSDSVWLSGAKIGLTTWTGVFEQQHAIWLRWCERDGKLLLTGTERAVQEKVRADHEKVRADHEKIRADHEKARAERLAARLRELGADDV